MTEPNHQLCVGVLMEKSKRTEANGENIQQITHEIADL